MDPVSSVHSGLVEINHRELPVDKPGGQMENTRVSSDIKSLFNSFGESND
tara:strand:- start:2703 stop:2852 length:150 start_codon:yes stop_codon:yes gene_type:complete